MVLCKIVCDKEHLTLQNNYRVTKKFPIAKFDCITKVKMPTDIHLNVNLTFEK
jgi:hypothetical protein